MKPKRKNRAAGRSRGGKRKCPAVPSGSTPPSAAKQAKYWKMVCPDMAKVMTREEWAQLGIV